MQSLRAQGKEEQAVMIEKRFRKAWNRADVALTASRFMGKSHSLASTGAALLDDKGNESMPLIVRSEIVGAFVRDQAEK